MEEFMYNAEPKGGNMENEKLTNPPAALNVKSIKQWLIDNGLGAVVSASTLAEILGVSRKTIKNAENARKLIAVDKCTYSLDSIAGWLLANPRYVAQQKKRVEVTESTYALIKNVLLSKYPKLIELYHGEVDDCTHEVAYRLGKTAMGRPCSEYTLVIRAINNLWNSKQMQTANRTVSIETVSGTQYV